MSFAPWNEGGAWWSAGAAPVAAHSGRTGARIPQSLCGWHRESLATSYLSRRCLFDHCPTGGIVHQKGSFRGSLRDEDTTFVRIIVKEGQVCQRKIKMAHVGQSGPITMDHHVIRDVVPSGTRRATLSSAACGDGNHRNTSVTRQRAILQRRSRPTWARPEQVVSNAKLCRSLTRPRIRSIMSRPAVAAVRSALNGDNPRAISSALTNSRM